MDLTSGGYWRSCPRIAQAIERLGMEWKLVVHSEVVE
jgi:hypothetical protein